MHVNEKDLWNFLRVDVISNADSPPNSEPADSSFIRTLIDSAEKRLEKFIGHSLDDFDVFPDELSFAIMIDVSVHYFDRINPTLPQIYDENIMPFRAWGFGRAVETDG